MSATFDQIVASSGLSAIFAKAVVRRAVERAGLSAETLRPNDVDVVLPELERALLPFLGAGASERILKIRRIGQ